MRNLNATDHLDLGLKLRVLAGVWAPNWAKDIGGAPIQLINPQNSAVGTIGRFWTPGFGQAYDQLEGLLAAKYDNVPEVREVNITRCTTFYDEPFIRDSGYQPNDTALLDAGFTMSADETCQREEIDDAPCGSTRTRTSRSTPTRWSTPRGSCRTDEPFTESMMEYCRQVLGIACVLENNSLRIRPSRDTSRCTRAWNPSGSRSPSRPRQPRVSVALPTRSATPSASARLGRAPRRVRVHSVRPRASRPPHRRSPATLRPDDANGRAPAALYHLRVGP